MSYPVSARSERWADNVVQITGLALGLIGSVALLIHVAVRGSTADVVAVTVYAAATMIALAASAAYHIAPWDRIRPVLRRIDHAAIYLKIAGTFTPLVVIVGGATAYGLLAAVWTLAVAGAVAKIAFWRSPGRRSTLLYIGMGWLGALLIGPMSASMPPTALTLVLFGGAIYTIGAAVHSAKGLRYNTAIWHAMVLVATGCIFTALAMATAV